MSSLAKVITGLSLILLTFYSCKKADTLGNKAITGNGDPRIFIEASWVGRAHFISFQAVPGGGGDEVFADTETIVGNSDGTITVNGKIFTNTCELDTITSSDYTTSSDCPYIGYGSCLFDSGYTEVTMTWYSHSGSFFAMDTFWGTK